MSKESVALIYKFLTENDGTCAEIFKRGFNPDVSCVENLPSLDEIVQNHIKSKNKEQQPPLQNPLDESLKSSKIMAIAQKNPSEFLERIVKKRVDDVESDTSSETDTTKTSSSDSEVEIVSAKKRRRLGTNSKKNIWPSEGKKRKRND